MASVVMKKIIQCIVLKRCLVFIVVALNGYCFDLTFFN